MTTQASTSPLPRHQVGVREWLWLGATWACCSLLLLLARPSYPFPPFELLDSWFYTGYQWDLRDQIADFGPTYYGSRLTWILPGAALHQILPPGIAEICFKLLFSGALAAGAAAVVLCVAHWRWAIVAVALATLAPQIVIALQTDYVDGPVIVYATLALGCISLARASARWPFWLVAGGGAIAAMLVVNIGSASTIGLGLAAFHLLWLRWNIKRTALAAACYLAGAGLVVVLLALASKWYGGPLNFMEPQFEMLRFFKNTEHNPWMPENREWLTRATWLILPLGALAWAGVRLVSTRGSDTPKRRMMLALATGLGSALIAGAIVEGRGTGAALSHPYYASFLLALALPLLVLLAADHFGAREPSSRWLSLSLALLAITAVVLPPLGTIPLLDKITAALLGHPGRGAPLVALAAILALPLLAGSTLRRWTAPVGIALFGLWAYLSTPDSYYAREATDHLRERYLAVHRAYFALKQELAGENYRFWIDSHHRDGVSLASTKLWGYRLLTQKPFPELEQTAQTDQTIVVPMAPGTGAAGAEKLRLGFEHRLVSPDKIRVLPVPGSHGVGFDLLLFKLQNRLDFDPHAPLPPRTQVQMLAGYEYGRAPAYTTELKPIFHLNAPAVLISHDLGYPIYHRVHARDFLATDYRFPPAATAGQRRVLTLDAFMPAAADCALQVQDENSTVLGEFTLRAPGRTAYNLELSENTKAFRVTFSSPRASATPLPVNLNIYLFTVDEPAKP